MSGSEDTLLARVCTSSQPSEPSTQWGSVVDIYSTGCGGRNLRLRHLPLQLWGLLRAHTIALCEQEELSIPQGG